MKYTAAPPLGPLLVDVAGTELTAEDRRLLADETVGGAILFTRNYQDPEQLAELTRQMRQVRPNLLIVADYEGGRVQRFRQGFTAIPAMRRLGQLYQQDRQQACQVARSLASLMVHELQAVGIDMPLAPVADLDYQWDAAAIGSRAFASDAAAVSELTTVFAQALRQAGSAATAKHFPGQGHVSVDSHLELPVDDRDWTELQQDMAPFATLIRQDVESVLMAHVHYPAVDDKPASLSLHWIQDILRDKLAFTGCVFCDDLSMGGAAVWGDYARRARLALKAGCNFLPVCNDRQATQVASQAIKAAGLVERGQDKRAQLARQISAARERQVPQDSESLAQARQLAKLYLEQ